MRFPEQFMFPLEFIVVIFNLLKIVHIQLSYKGSEFRISAEILLENFFGKVLL